MSRTELENTNLFVFYTLDKENASWSYPKLPNGWNWIGSGSVAPISKKPRSSSRSRSRSRSRSISSRSQIYQVEEQFSGPKVSMNKTRDILEKVFTKLKNNKLIKVFKIQKAYLK